MLGSATSCFSLTLGGVTMVCERLSASGGSEMMGCRENSGSALLGAAVARCGYRAEEGIPRPGNRSPRRGRRRASPPLAAAAQRSGSIQSAARMRRRDRRRIGENGPREPALHEYVRPEGRRGGAQFERRKPARKNEVAQVAEEDPRPRRQLDQKPRNGRGLLDFAGKPGCSHLIYSRCGNADSDSREDISPVEI